MLRYAIIIYTTDVSRPEKKDQVLAIVCQFISCGKNLGLALNGHGTLANT